uniref:Uncharacterized protein n=1 Tax=Steinernema glaseri TaxID=37863 RepID=A0A1I7YT31_9BILA
MKLLSTVGFLLLAYGVFSERYCVAPQQIFKSSSESLALENRIINFITNSPIQYIPYANQVIKIFNFLYGLTGRNQALLDFLKKLDKKIEVSLSAVERKLNELHLTLLHTNFVSSVEQAEVSRALKSYMKDVDDEERRSKYCRYCHSAYLIASLENIHSIYTNRNAELFLVYLPYTNYGAQEAHNLRMEIQQIAVLLTAAASSCSQLTTRSAKVRESEREEIKAAFFAILKDLEYWEKYRAGKSMRRSRQ